MINIPKGTKDLLPQDSYKWHYIEDTARQVAAAFNLKEIRTPIFEHTELFTRGVGDTTDIVNKEMYTFLDKGERSITLKPEGTAGVARSFIENSMHGGVLPVKMYYLTPVFRYERPQAGRLRQHHQFGVEIYGAQNADTDAEVIALADTFFKKLKISGLKLFINSIGCPKCRPNYNQILKEYLNSHLNVLCKQCAERIEKNPLRVLDCKEKSCIEINKGAPKITDHICAECENHFKSLQEYLSLANIDFEINPYIVRGLDYYTKTVFEFVSQNIGAQGTVCGGGRYDFLVESLGGTKTACVGFGMGIERLLLTLENLNIEIKDTETVEIYIASIGDAAQKKAFSVAASLRKQGVFAEFDHLLRNIKPQFKYADKIGAKYIAVIGENELNSGEMSLKNMSTGESQTLSFENIANFIKKNR